MGRFLNADAVYDTDAGLQGYNIFIYCGNNPVNRIDISGADSIAMADGDVDEDDPFTVDGSGGNGKAPSEPPRAGGTNGSNSTTTSNSSAPAQNIPQEAWNTYNYVQTHNGSPPQGYKGGRQFTNDGRNGGQQLPSNGTPYYEYDIYPWIRGVSRGTERIVIGASGVAWYTADHYTSFIRMV